MYLETRIIRASKIKLISCQIFFFIILKFGRYEILQLSALNSSNVLHFSNNSLKGEIMYQKMSFNYKILF